MPDINASIDDVAREARRVSGLLDEAIRQGGELSEKNIELDFRVRRLERVVAAALHCLRVGKVDVARRVLEGSWSATLK